MVTARRAGRILVWPSHTVAHAADAAAAIESKHGETCPKITVWPTWRDAAENMVFEEEGEDVNGGGSLPEGAVAHLDFVNGFYYASGAEHPVGDLLGDGIRDGAPAGFDPTYIQPQGMVFPVNEVEPTNFPFVIGPLRATIEGLRATGMTVVVDLVSDIAVASAVSNPLVILTDTEDIFMAAASVEFTLSQVDAPDGHVATFVDLTEVQSAVDSRILLAGQRHLVAATMYEENGVGSFLGAVAQNQDVDESPHDSSYGLESYLPTIGAIALFHTVSAIPFQGTVKSVTFYPANVKGIADLIELTTFVNDTSYDMPMIRFSDQYDTYLGRGAPLSTTNSPIGFLSVWFKEPADSDNPLLASSTPDGAVYIECGGRGVNVGLYNSDNTQSVVFDSSPNLYLGQVRTHILIAWDMGHGAGLKRLAVYVNDILISGTPTDGDPAFDVGVVEDDFFACSAEGSENNTAFGDYGLWIGASIVEANSTISETNRRKFISAGGHPVDPTNWPASPVIKLSGNVSTWPVNQGSGGAFTLTGTITDE